MNGDSRPGGQWPSSRLLEACRFLLRQAARSVPVLRRAEWLAEWEAELWVLQSRGASPLKLLRYALSGFGEARWEKRNAEGRMGGIIQDIRYSVRRLSRSPGFSLITVMVLALGIGSNTALFSALKAALLDGPPYPESDRIVAVDLLLEQRAGVAADTMPWSWPKFMLAREQLHSLELLAGYSARTHAITGDGPPARIGVEYVTPSYFELLGATAAAGRLFGEEAEYPAPGAVVVLSHDVWQTRYGGDRSVIGRTLTVDGSPLEIVGVARAGFAGATGSADVFIPTAGIATISGPRRLQQAWAHWLHVLARLPAGTTLEQAMPEAARAGLALTSAYPDPSGNGTHGVALVPFNAARVNPVARLAVIAVSAGGILLLLIACGNVGGLLLARQSARRSDTAVRTALGAGRGRLLREFLIESLLLSGVGGALGLILAWTGQRAVGFAAAAALDTTGTRGLQFLDPASLKVDGGVLVAGVVLALLTGLLFGALPALIATRTDVSNELHRTSHTVGRRAASQFGRALLVTTQLALTVVLLAGAGLLAASFSRLSAVDVGFTNDDVLTLSWDLGPGHEADEVRSFESLLSERIGALPGVQAVSIAPCPPLAGRCEVVGLRQVDDQPPIDYGDIDVGLVAYAVSDDYFRTLGIPLEEGRAFSATDGPASPPVAVINAAAARELWPGQSPIGHRMAVTHELTRDRMAEVVGVVADVHYAALEEGAMPAVYFSRTQAPAPYGTLFVAADQPLTLVDEVRSAVAGLNSELPLFAISTMADRRARATARTRVVLWLLGAFAATALLLSAIGLYGLVAWAVVRRTREMGLRLALGAAAPDILRLVIGPTGALAAAGIAVGLSASWGLTRFVAALLYGIEPSDPAVLASAALVLLAVATLAAWVPARKATRVDPAVALRSD